MTNRRDAESDSGLAESTPEDVSQAVRAAHDAFPALASAGPATRASLLRGIARELQALGDALLDSAAAETALPLQRLVGERARTVGQLEMFAALVEEGSWVDARIDTAIADRRPTPKPDLRRLLVPIGPVAVFGASNFPLAFCAAGGDTASALASGCPVVMKPHPAHARTADMAVAAVCRAVAAVGLPRGVFTAVHGESHEVGLSLVRHPLVRAVAFTGSLRGGRALFDLAASRPDPISVFAEMGSLNPVFLLASALEGHAEELAEAFAASMTLGVGQFCTKPGVVVAVRGPAFERFAQRLADEISSVAPGRMLSPALASSYRAAVDRVRARCDVLVAGRSSGTGATSEGHAVVLRTTMTRFVEDECLRSEMFGPAALVVEAEDDGELEELALALPGQLTATIHASDQELAAKSALVSTLQQKAGRLVFNGFPTGLEVCPSTEHGGPYPATTDARSTSVGTDAILRFARPVCYQSFPQAVLPVELRDRNYRGIWRTLNGALTRADVER
ncbi:MAG TPA: aldehyde dehydrogenase (NADP(+)) [Vicinamibacterales bacterium]|jgi:NADP-dependent aldehyde dehydrogenase